MSEKKKNHGLMKFCAKPLGIQLFVAILVLSPNVYSDEFDYKREMEAFQVMLCIT